MAIPTKNAPLLWPSARRIEGRTLAAVMRVIDKLERDLIAIIGGVITEKATMDIEPECCHDLREKKLLNEDEINNLRFRLEQLIGKPNVDLMDNAFRRAAEALFVGDGQAQFLGAIFNEFYKAAIEDGYKQSYIDFAAAAKRDTVLRKLIGGVAKEVKASERMPLVQELYKTGFDLVTSAITQKYAPTAFQIIADGYEQKKLSAEIVAEIRNKVGKGQRWHWRRLVRTEAVTAFDKTSMETYRNSGVQYVKWTLSTDELTCPICKKIREKKPDGSTSGGYYYVATAPEISRDTHPNCRCRKYPIGNLPKGVKAN